MTLTQYAAKLVEWAKESTSRENYTADAGDGITLSISPNGPVITRVDEHQSRVEYGETVRAYVGETQAHESESVTFPDDLAAAAEQVIEQVRMSRRMAMPRALRDLDDITQRRRVVAAELAALDVQRDSAIMAAIEAGHGAPTIATHADLTAARVYQIRDR